MLKSHLQQSTKSLIPWSTKPFIFSREILVFFPINILSNKNPRKNQKKNNFIVHYNAANSTKAVLSSTKKSMGVKVVVKVQKSVGGTNLGLSRGLDDLLGKSLLLWIVAAELDPKTGIDKPSIRIFANRGRDVDGETQYEANFVFPEDFGDVGAILVENEHKEMYVKNIVIDGSPRGKINITCNSWVHTKFEKRIFFTNKVCKMLRTHCATEPYIIATNRQLSAMHPIYRLLHPHFRHTMKINSLAREALINANGIIETSFSLGKYAMEFSSVAYDLEWRFDQEALPQNLISRGLAVEDPNEPYGLKLTIQDYPFANDGLVLWDTLKQWVTNYVNHYYPQTNLIESDKEIQAWWSEIKNVGHGDKKNEPWWPELKTPNDLIGIITTMIWVTSGHHAAVNFGQYIYAGYFPNRPTIARTKMPTEDPTNEEWESFLNKPEEALLKCLPSQLQATKLIAIMDVLSNHAPDEEYIGEIIEPYWAEDPVINAAFEVFSGKLKEFEGIIDARNVDSKLMNRNGAGVMPYELLKPFSEPGVTGKGVPYSISI
ncbi:linoleate 13S-lipoxygenase 2-1, chloroplastic-like [Solanum stenotomum]|uniref:linoleate 13S-lipoxygenase 2-1, chloroplastic-like n=1 Tax=Solanum stenotomum TaxID=172797 RepID=UPI0020D02EAA|nr:linoleate 13S-lipoxygenase 2-1, chloroplastic-like [Solanum stenotomum]